MKEKNDLTKTMAFAKSLDRRLGTLEAIETGDQFYVLKPMLRASLLTSTAKLAGPGKGALLFALTVATSGSKSSPSFEQMIAIFTKALRPLFPQANLGQRDLLPLLLKSLMLGAGTLTQILIPKGTSPLTVNLLIQFVHQTKLIQQLAEGVAKACGSDQKTCGLATKLLAGMILLLIVQTGSRGNLKVVSKLLENLRADLIQLLEGPSDFLAEALQEDSEARRGVVQLQTFIEALRQEDLEAALAVANSFQQALWNDGEEHDFAKEIFVEFEELSQLLSGKEMKIEGEDAEKQAYINFI